MYYEVNCAFYVALVSEEELGRFGVEHVQLHRRSYSLIRENRIRQWGAADGIRRRETPPPTPPPPPTEEPYDTGRSTEEGVPTYHLWGCPLHLWGWWYRSFSDNLR